MLFKRRHKPSLTSRAYRLLWPRRGPVRAAKYVWHRLARMPDTSHRLAAGFASGAAVSFTPFLGFHFGLAFVVAFLVRGNFIAAAIGTAVGNPWTFPFFFALAGQTANLILGEGAAINVPPFAWDAFSAAPIAYVGNLLASLYPLIIGSIPIALTAWLLSYLGLKGVIAGYKKARHRRVLASRCTRHPNDEACA